MELAKIKTYVNFAKKSNKILFGVDDIVKSKNICLILISNDLASSSKNKLQNYTEKHKIINFYLTNSQIFEICEIQSVKVIAITDKNLANAIKENLPNNR